ncbi:hypothetical protein INR49_014755 [Caranx melampygus]|nr:hypothetical protein INR49_014755 [Caranx melampygus]
MEKETAGAFLVNSVEDKGMKLSVRLPAEQGAPLVQSLMGHPDHPTEVTPSHYHDNYERGAGDYWTSDVNQQTKNQDLNHTSVYLYVNPVTVEQSPNNDLNHCSVPKLDVITSQNSTSSMENGEASQKVTPEDKGQTKTTTNQEIKYKRPPPRPPA